MRKKNFLAIILALILVIAMGCLDIDLADEPIVKQDKKKAKNFKLMGSVQGHEFTYAHYGVIEIDNIEYVVVVANAGVAVCPKDYK